MRNAIHLMPAVAWGVVIAYLSLTSPEALPKVQWSMFDKLAHVGVYFIFSGLLYYGILKQAASYTKKQFLLVLTLLIASLLGISLEVLQYVGSAGRSFEMLDILANIIGSFVGIAAYSLFH